MNETLSKIGEREILNRLKRFMDEGQIDDDTALLKNKNQDLLINTDLLVEGVHFNDQTMSAKDIGWKAITSNVSDLAASGLNEMVAISVGLVAPASTKWDWVEKVYEGMEQALHQYGGKLTGGDCSNGNQKMLSITAIGTLGPLRLHRSNASPGDCLVTSGSHGLSRLGFALLVSEKIMNLKNLPYPLQSKAIQAHQRPHPAIKALKALEESKPNYLPWRAGGTDSSDGLLEAIKNLCISSGCRAVINPLKLPRAEGWPKGTLWDEWCLNGGEDYELVISLPEVWANEWIKAIPNASKIGRIEEGLPQVIWENGKEVNGENLTSKFIHF